MLFCLQRPTKVKIKAQDATGKKFQLTLSGWRARIFQHEYDHLQVRMDSRGLLQLNVCSCSTCTVLLGLFSLGEVCKMQRNTCMLALYHVGKLDRCLPCRRGHSRCAEVGSRRTKMIGGFISCRASCTRTSWSARPLRTSGVNSLPWRKRSRVQIPAFRSEAWQSEVQRLLCIN